MTKTVFISGSIKIKKLSIEQETRIDNIIANRLHVVIGDDGGVDLAVQKKLVGYPYVTVYHTALTPRNNVGMWQTKHITTLKSLKGALLHQEKDKAMVAVADYALVVWDGESTGSLANMFRMALRGKKSVILHGTDGIVVNNLEQAVALVRSAPEKTKIELKKRLSAVEAHNLTDHMQIDIFG